MWKNFCFIILTSFVTILMLSGCQTLESPSSEERIEKISIEFDFCTTSVINTSTTRSAADYTTDLSANWVIADKSEIEYMLMGLQEHIPNKTEVICKNETYELFQFDTEWSKAYEELSRNEIAKEFIFMRNKSSNEIEKAFKVRDEYKLNGLAVINENNDVYFFNLRNERGYYLYKNANSGFYYCSSFQAKTMTDSMMKSDQLLAISTNRKFAALSGTSDGNYIKHLTVIRLEDDTQQRVNLRKTFDIDYDVHKIVISDKGDLFWGYDDQDIDYFCFDASKTYETKIKGAPLYINNNNTSVSFFTNYAIKRFDKSGESDVFLFKDFDTNAKIDNSKNKRTYNINSPRLELKGSSKSIAIEL